MSVSEFFKVIEQKVLNHERLTFEDALKLFETGDIFRVGKLAEIVCKRFNANNAYYIINHHINPTNICVNRCRFCAFSRSLNDTDAYELDIDEVIKNIKLKGIDFSEFHIVGGLHPHWSLDKYLYIVKAMKDAFPTAIIKAYTATEIDYIARVSKLDLKDVLARLKNAGLDMMPGGGAEIFSPQVRKKLCPEKIDADRWLEVMRTAHSLGIKSNATMLYGHTETYAHRVEHLMRLRELQDKTGGFIAFIPLAYHPSNTDLGGKPSSAFDDLMTIAVSRLVLDNIPHIKAYWIMLGEKLSQTALLFGADDLDGTVIEEKITHSAGGKTSGSITQSELEHLIRQAGRVPVRRDGFYNPIAN